MEKIKQYVAAHKKEVALGVILFFVVSLSFALGYAASRQFDHAPIIIEKSS